MKVSILIIALVGIFAVATASPVIPKNKRFIDQKALQEAMERIKNEIIMPAFDAQLKNIALMAAQIFAGISQDGIKGLQGLGKREEKRLIGFFKDLHNDVLYPTINNLAQALAGMSSHIFAGLAENGIGKREEKRLISFFKDLHNDVLYPTINSLAQALAGMSSHIFAGLAENGIGKRTVEENIELFTPYILSSLKDYLNKVYEKTFEKLNEKVKSNSLSIAEFLSDIAENGLGKRSDEQLVDESIELFTPYILSSLKDYFNSAYEKAFNALNEKVKSNSLSIAEFLSDIAENGLGK